MAWKNLEVERTGPVLRVWLNRPERRNALDGATLEEIAALFTDLQRDFESRVVILAGRGLSFSAGADRKSPPGAATAETGSESGRSRVNSSSSNFIFT